jgi:hypothetical protein
MRVGLQPHVNGRGKEGASPRAVDFVVASACAVIEAKTYHFLQNEFSAHLATKSIHLPTFYRPKNLW